MLMLVRQSLRRRDDGDGRETHERHEHEGKAALSAFQIDAQGERCATRRTSVHQDFPPCPLDPGKLVNNEAVEKFPETLMVSGEEAKRHLWITRRPCIRALRHLSGM